MAKSKSSMEKAYELAASNSSSLFDKNSLEFNGLCKNVISFLEERKNVNQYIKDLRNGMVHGYFNINPTHLYQFMYSNVDSNRELIPTNINNTDLSLGVVSCNSNNNAVAKRLEIFNMSSSDMQEAFIQDFKQQCKNIKQFGEDLKKARKANPRNPIQEELCFDAVDNAIIIIGECFNNSKIGGYKEQIDLIRKEFLHETKSEGAALIRIIEARNNSAHMIEIAPKDRTSIIRACTTFVNYEHEKEERQKKPVILSTVLQNKENLKEEIIEEPRIEMLNTNEKVKDSEEVTKKRPEIGSETERQKKLKADPALTKKVDNIKENIQKAKENMANDPTLDAKSFHQNIKKKSDKSRDK